MLGKLNAVRKVETWRSMLDLYSSRTREYKIQSEVSMSYPVARFAFPMMPLTRTGGQVGGALGRQGLHAPSAAPGVTLRWTMTVHIPGRLGRLIWRDVA